MPHRQLPTDDFAATEREAERPWYDEAFGEGYARVYAHHDLAEARRDVAALVERGLVGPFLDLGCGAGRHLVAAAELGLVGAGVDRSPVLVAAARAAGCRVVRGDVRALPFRDARFAAVTCLFSSFGYFDPAGDLAQLREARRVLVRGGSLWLDLADATLVRALLVPESERRLGRRRVHEQRWLAEGGRRVRKVVRLVEPDGVERAWTEDLALYEPDELEDLLRAAGLEPEARWSALGAPSAGVDAGRLVVRARRP